ncbi:hypothetical protein Afil01_17620 [Actinorhabdospora filicis]|uniref:DUF1579 domain-containing protein n=1 Tax=Actinorhabdospora filicis TaxID=1785913 RepID=A0A9W6W9T9_9ACTN|nr:hypothetical protein [Actinorhabdospora filicis]GLZ76955.1 hypothetical protein Afil01_17620 [Actinorhabdospora filicis]
MRSEHLKALGDLLVGTWTITGQAKGTTTYEWAEGGHFLIQRCDITHDGHTGRGFEVVGHLQPFGEEPQTAIRSRFYGADGATLDYEYELDGDILTIWGGEKGSPAYCRCVPADGVIEAAWVWPGGGYTATLTKETGR